jgi:hypothetical protein
MADEFLEWVVFPIFERIYCEIVDMLCSQRTENCKSQFKIFNMSFSQKLLRKNFLLLISLKNAHTMFFVKMYARHR